VTEWFAGANWNWTISPTAALMSFGEYANVPFAFPTFTTWTVTAPVGIPDMAEVGDAAVSL